MLSDTDLPVPNILLEEDPNRLPKPGLFVSAVGGIIKFDFLFTS